METNHQIIKLCNIRCVRDHIVIHSRGFIKEDGGLNFFP